MSPKTAKHLVLLLAATLGSCAVLSIVFDTRKSGSNARNENANVTHLPDLPIPDGVADSEAQQYRQGSVVQVGGLRLFIPLAYQINVPQNGNWLMGFVWPSLRGTTEWNSTHGINPYTRRLVIERSAPYGRFFAAPLGRDEEVINRNSLSEAEADFRYIYREFSIIEVHSQDDERGRIVLQANPSILRMHPVVIPDRFRMMQTRDGTVVHERCPSSLEGEPVQGCRSAFRYMGLGFSLEYPRDTEWVDVHEQMRNLVTRLTLPGGIEIPTPHNVEPLGIRHLPEGSARDPWFPARNVQFPVPEGVESNNVSRWYHSGRLQSLGGRTYFLPRAFDQRTSPTNARIDETPVPASSLNFHAAWPSMRGEAEWRFFHGMWANISPRRIWVNATPFNSNNHSGNYSWSNKTEALDNFFRIYQSSYSIQIEDGGPSYENNWLVAQAALSGTINLYGLPAISRLFNVNGLFLIEICGATNAMSSYQSCSSSFMWSGLVVNYHFPSEANFHEVHNWVEYMMKNMHTEGKR